MNLLNNKPNQTSIAINNSIPQMYQIPMKTFLQQGISKQYLSIILYSVKTKCMNMMLAVIKEHLNLLVTNKKVFFRRVFKLNKFSATLKIFWGGMEHFIFVFPTYLIEKHDNLFNTPITDPIFGKILESVTVINRNPELVKK